MKKFLILILIFVSQQTFSQKENIKICKTPKTKIEAINNDENRIYNPLDIEIKPEFPRGQQALDKFIKENYKNPKDTSLKGNVYVTFIIEKDGSLSDIKVLKDIGSGTGTEAIRVLKASPKWIPGKQNDKEVRTLYSLVVPVQQ
ncbi:energy transducer TonB [Flavobacterium sp. CFBP9031]|uniref:Energy transducer TonB n=1 Tax=Flavobacterium chungangensis TaxID=2708132 RepID=A0ABV8ZB17_9FLAO|nr:energy transducer TonB [Flavobacterium sp. CFBP9031]MDY0986450.1 energy transducer TonB [Flavobacterium sp. CFBP9031]